MIKAFDKYSNFSNNNNATQEPSTLKMQPVQQKMQPVQQEAQSTKSVQLQCADDELNTTAPDRNTIGAQAGEVLLDDFKLQYTPDYKTFNQAVMQCNECHKKSIRRKLFKHIHGIKVIKPAKLDELHLNSRIIGYVSYKRRHQSERKIGVLKIGITNWDIVGAQDEASALRGYIPVGNNNIVGIYETFDLYDRIFLIVFTVVSVLAFYLCYVSGGGG